MVLKGLMAGILLNPYDVLLIQQFITKVCLYCQYIYPLTAKTYLVREAGDR